MSSQVRVRAQIHYPLQVLVIRNKVTERYAFDEVGTVLPITLTVLLLVGGGLEDLRERVAEEHPHVWKLLVLNIAASEKRLSSRLKVVVKSSKPVSKGTRNVTGSLFRENRIVQHLSIS